MRCPEHRLSRRNALLSGAGLITAVATGVVLTPAVSAGETSGTFQDPTSLTADRVLAGQYSANGWEMQNGADIGGAIWTKPVAGSVVSVAVHIGDVETLLLHVVRRFHYEVDALRAGEVVGFRAPNGSLVGHETNHASGTAVDIRPGWYPPGVRGGLSPYETAVVRDILADCEGVVAWGGDFSRPYESHFQIDVGPSDLRLAKAADKIRSWNNTPGLGAGVMLAGA